MDIESPDLEGRQVARGFGADVGRAIEAEGLGLLGSRISAVLSRRPWRRNSAGGSEMSREMIQTGSLKSL
jgi:hypothetical protein